MISQLARIQKSSATVSKFSVSPLTLSGPNTFDVFGPSSPIGTSGPITDLADIAVQGLCDRLPTQTLRDACNRIAGGGGGGAGIAPTDALPSCPGILSVRGPDGTCINLGDLGPRGDPAITSQPGRAVQGAFGMPATTPTSRTRTTRKCPKRMVLGFDDLCYPKAILPRRSKFRKWRGDPRPTLSAGDEKAIRRAARSKDRVLKLAKEAGLHASKSKPASKAKACKHD